MVFKETGFLVEQVFEEASFTVDQWCSKNCFYSGSVVFEKTG